MALTYIYVGFLLWLWVGLPLLIWYVLKSWPAPSLREWEIVEPGGRQTASNVGDGTTPPIQEAMRVLREKRVMPVDQTAPWDTARRQAQPGVSFPESWRLEWPDPPPEPSKLPDEEG
jgi:hypothetical protein